MHQLDTEGYIVLSSFMRPALLALGSSAQVDLITTAATERGWSIYDCGLDRDGARGVRRLDPEVPRQVIEHGGRDVADERPVPEEAKVDLGLVRRPQVGHVRDGCRVPLAPAREASHPTTAAATATGTRP